MVRIRKRGAGRMGRNMGKTMIRQILLCILILLIVILAKKMDTAIVQHAVDTIKTQFASDVTVIGIKEAGKSAFLRLKDGTTAVVASLSLGNKYLEFSTPSDIPGSYSTAAGEPNSGHTIEFQSDQEIQVYAAAGGTVSDIGTDASKNHYIKIYHGNDILSLYGGCTTVYVQPLEKVKRGQIIASVIEGEGQKLSFEIWVDGKLTDPAEYIKF